MPNLPHSVFVYIELGPVIWAALKCGPIVNLCAIRSLDHMHTAEEITTETNGENEAPRRNLRVAEFCERAPMAKSTFWALVKDGKIPVIRFGTLTVVPWEAGERILREGTH